MSIKKIALFLLMHCFFSLHALSDEQLFKNGNEQYACGEYAVALTVYEAIQKKGSVVWYNMGNASYQLGQRAHARAYWLRASQHAPSELRAHVVQNLALFDQVPRTRTQKMYDVFLHVIACIPMIVMQFFCILVWMLLCFFLFRKKKRARMMMCVLLIVNCVALSMLAVKYLHARKVCGVVVQSTAQLFACPQIQYHTLGQLPESAVVDVIELRPSWYKIKHAVGTGWMCADDIMIV